jgi:hypothetical protein
MDMRFGTWNVRSIYKAEYKMNLGETGWRGMDRINLAQDRDQGRVLVNMVTDL